MDLFCGAKNRQAVEAASRTFFFCLLAGACAAQTIRVEAGAGDERNRITPVEALGAGVDRLPYGATDTLLSGEALKAALDAGWQRVSYRQNTELHVEAWHWNPRGAWSEAGDRGYFRGSAEPGEAIRHSWGYPLPRRGFTRNDGTDRSGYSRLDDGSEATFWKSNPYLSRRYTGEPDAAHPQWVVIDLDGDQEVNAMRIAWGEPYARKYFVQMWTGSGDPIKAATKGAWQTFPAGEVDAGRGGTVTLRLAGNGVRVRYLRIWMTESSDTCTSGGSGDARNCAGYAIGEVYAGTLEDNGTFHDAMRHSTDQEQTTTYCSSVDPWHEAADVDEKAGDQAGLDLFYTSGVTRGQPAMVPIAMLYGTPEDAVAEIEYLEKRKYPIAYVEMGEEPDGQFMLPEDYAALYVQFARALHKLDPGLKLGGPVFEGVNSDILVWPDADGRTSWLGRFLAYLKVRGAMNELSFFSFEHYPFDPCKLNWETLYDEPAEITGIMKVWREDGLPPTVPMLVTETNISWNLNEAFVTMYGGLWEADYIGSFLTAGGRATYYFHYLPLPLGRGCDGGWGTFSMQTADARYKPGSRTAQYFASRLISREWVEPGTGEHGVYAAASDVTDEAGRVLVTAYALKRPDGRWSIMVLNKDREKEHRVRIMFHDAEQKADRGFTGDLRRVTFGPAQYRWHADGAQGFAEPDGPPAAEEMKTTPAAEYVLPAASISVFTGAVGR